MHYLSRQEVVSLLLKAEATRDETSTSETTEASCRFSQHAHVVFDVLSSADAT